LPTYEEVMKKLGKKGVHMPRAPRGPGAPGTTAMAMIKCPHCDETLPIRIRIEGFRLAVDYPMSKRDLAKQGQVVA